MVIWENSISEFKKLSKSSTPQNEALFSFVERSPSVGQLLAQLEEKVRVVENARAQPEFTFTALELGLEPPPHFNSS